MKLALSNICLNSKEDFDKLVEEQGLAVESAYNKLHPRSIAVQGLLYDMPSTFSHRDGSFERVILERLLHISNFMNTSRQVKVVFGAPKARNTRIVGDYGNLKTKLQNIKEFESKLGAKTNLCVENVARHYGSTVYTTTYSIVDDKFPLSYDIGNAFLEKEEISADHDWQFARPKHVHISAPNLIPISAVEDPEYFQFLRASIKSLASVGYLGYISIEMKPCTYWEAKESVLLVKEMLNEVQSI